MNKAEEKNIKNLLFDLGGVIMDLKRQNCVDALVALGMTDADQRLGLYVQKDPFLKLEEGKISPEEFLNELRGYMRPGVTDAQIVDAFNAFLVGIPVERLRKLVELRKKYRIYVLSNTNEIMWNSKIDSEFRKDGHDLDYYVDGCVTSFDAGVCKPDARIFREVENRFGLVPEETLFFDDSAANCEAAAKLGFHTVTVAPGTDFSQYI